MHFERRARFHLGPWSIPTHEAVQNAPPTSRCTTCFLSLFLCLRCRPGFCTELHLDIRVMALGMHIVVPTVRSLVFIRYLMRCV
jgi:hypothetical protein